MNVLKTALLAAASMTVASAAFAADPIMPAPAPIVPVVDNSSVWDGFYAGANVGYGWGEVDGLAGFDDIEGWLGGAQLGYNIALSGVVLGVEGDYQFSDIKDGDIGINHFGTVRARVGADMGGFLPYLTAGVAFGEFDDGVDQEYDWGWTAGAGVEAMVMDNLSVKGEYLYMNFEDIADSGVDSEVHTARVGLNFHF